MAHARETVTVERNIREVFEFLADGNNEPSWRPDVTHVELGTDDARAVGTVWRQKMNGPGGRTIDGDYRITRYEEPTLLAFEVIAGPARPVGEFVLREVSPSVTEVTFTLDLVPTGVMRLMSGMIAKQVAKEAAAIRHLPDAMNSKGS